MRHRPPAVRRRKRARDSRGDPSQNAGAAGVVDPDLPPKLQDIINTLLKKEPELRFQNAAGLRSDLKRLKRDLESGHTELVTASSGRIVRYPCEVHRSLAPPADLLR